MESKNSKSEAIVWILMSMIVLTAIGMAVHTVVSGGSPGFIQNASKTVKDQLFASSVTHSPAYQQAIKHKSSQTSASEYARPAPSSSPLVKQGHQWEKRWVRVDGGPASRADTADGQRLAWACNGWIREDRRIRSADSNRARRYYCNMYDEYLATGRLVE